MQDCRQHSHVWVASNFERVEPREANTQTNLSSVIDLLAFAGLGKEVMWIVPVNNNCLLFGAVTSIAVANLVVVVRSDQVFYDWTIQSRLSLPPLSPDCYVEREMLLVNNECPGPTIRANLGDTVHIQWRNMHPSEGVSIHYHGLLMQNQPYADGTGGVSTCIVGPMQTFQHEFVVDNAGTHYWHGHTSLDRMDCLQGLVIVEDPNDLEEQALKDMYDEERVLFLQDWYHRSGPTLRTGK